MYLQYHNFWTVSPPEWKSDVFGIIEFLVKEKKQFPAVARDMQK